MFGLHTVARERDKEREKESVRVSEQTQRDMLIPARRNSLNANF